MFFFPGNTRKIICFLSFILFLGLFFSTCYNTQLPIEYFEEKRKKEIPKIVWTYWDSEKLPSIVEKCVNTWKKRNPNHEIRVINPSNLSTYLPEVDFKKIKHIEHSHARYSDMVRLHLLEKYGGIWADASIICIKPFDDWIPELQEKNNADLVAFYLNGFTQEDYVQKSPVIESWFLAAPAESVLIKDWLKEFLRINDYDDIDRYIEDIKKEGVNIQKIDPPNYLTIHVSCQKVLQQGDHKPYRFQALKAEDTAFNYLQLNKWDTDKAVQNLLDCDNGKSTECDFMKSPIIKMRGMERQELEKKDYSSFL